MFPRLAVRCPSLLLFLILAASPTQAQDARSLFPEKTLEDLTPMLDRVREGLEAISAEKPVIETLRSMLEAPSLSEANLPSWKSAIEKRRNLLVEWQKTLEERRQLRSVEAIQQMLDAARTARDELKNAPPPVLPLDSDEDALREYESRLAVARARLSSSTETYDSRAKALKDREAEIRTLPEREAAVRQAVEAAELDPEDSLGRYVDESARIELRVVAERRALCEAARARWPTLVEVREIEQDLARLEVERLRAVAEQAAAALKKILDRRASEAAARSARAKEEALRAEDPVERFRQGLISERESALKSRAEEENVLSALTRTLESQAEVNRRFEREFDQLRQRFEIGGAAAGRTAEVLLLTWRRVQDNQRVLRRRTLPVHYAEVERVMSLRADVQDRLWAVEVPAAEDPPDWLALEAEIPEARRAEALAAYDDEHTKLKLELRARRDQLDRIVSEMASLGDHYVKRLEILDALYAFVLQRIYWVRTDAAIGVETLVAIPREFADLGALYAGPRVRGGVAKAYGEAPGRFLLAALAFLAVVVTGGTLVHRLRRYRTRWKYRGAPVLVFLQRLGANILISSLAPLCLLVAIPLLGLLDLPDAITTPGTRLLLGLSSAYFARRFLWSFFREDGIAVTELKTPKDVSTQLLRASRRATAAVFFLAVPYWVLSGEPLGLIHAPRVLFSLLLVAGAVVLLGLLGRRRPLITAVTHQRGFWHKASLLLHLIVALGFAAIIAMDVLGYRFGARLLIANVLQTFVAALVLMGAYNFLVRLVDGAARKIWQRRRSEGANEMEITSARDATRQLTRFAGVVVIVVAVVLLARFWGLDAQIGSFLRAVALTTADPVTGVSLTLADVLAALLWIAGGHLLVRNLGSILEVTLFPNIGKVDRGSRFVVQTIARYLVLVIAYGAAIITLNFSFQSLGWILAAASVGIGFGLQEIISNFVSGLILLVERPVRVGDIVNVGTTAGTVQQINIRATIIENWDRQLMIVPNRKFITEDLINWTRNDDIMRTSIDVGVAYGTDVERVIRLLMETVKSHPAVLADPVPRVLFLSFGDSSLNLKVWYFTLIPERMQTLSEMQIRIARRFEEEGITIPFPQRDVWLRSDGDDIEPLASVMGTTPKPGNG